MEIIDKMIDQGVEEGLNLGLQRFLAERCDGYDDPEERCPMTPPYCACMCARYRKLYWWRKIFNSKPPEPTNEDCIDAIIRQKLGIL